MLRLKAKAAFWRSRVSSFWEEVSRAAQLLCTSVYCVTNCKKRLQIMEMKRRRIIPVFPILRRYVVHSKHDIYLSVSCAHKALPCSSVLEGWCFLCAPLISFHFNVGSLCLKLGGNVIFFFFFFWAGDVSINSNVVVRHKWCQPHLLFLVEDSLNGTRASKLKETGALRKLLNHKDVCINIQAAICKNELLTSQVIAPSSDFHRWPHHLWTLKSL